MNEDIINAAAAYCAKWVFKVYPRAAKELYQTRPTAFNYGLWIAQTTDLDETKSDHEKTNYLVSAIKSYFQDDIQRDQGITRKGQKRFEIPFDPFGMNEVARTLAVTHDFETIDKDIQTRDRVELVKRRLRSYDQKFGTEYAPKFELFEKAGFVEAEAARMFGNTRQAWSAFKIRVIDIINGAPPKKRDRSKK